MEGLGCSTEGEPYSALDSRARGRAERQGCAGGALGPLSLQASGRRWKGAAAKRLQRAQLCSASGMRSMLVLFYGYERRARARLRVSACRRKVA